MRFRKYYGVILCMANVLHTGMYSNTHTHTHCYPWHPLQRPQPTEVPMVGPLPRDWSWGNDFLPAMLRWLREPQWLQLDDDLLVGHIASVVHGARTGFRIPCAATPSTHAAITVYGLGDATQEKGRVV